MLRATAEEAMTQTGFVFDEATGMYYDHSTGFYYDSVREADFHTVAEVIFQLHGFKFNKCGAPVLFNSVFALPQLSQLYYDGNTGFYYYYDAESGRYQFHSKIEVTSAVVEDQNAGDKKGRKFKKWVNKNSEDTKVSSTCLFLRYIHFDLVANSRLLSL